MLSSIAHTRDTSDKWQSTYTLALISFLSLDCQFFSFLNSWNWTFQAFCPLSLRFNSVWQNACCVSSYHLRTFHESQNDFLHRHEFFVHVDRTLHRRSENLHRFNGNSQLSVIPSSSVHQLPSTSAYFRKVSLCLHQQPCTSGSTAMGAGGSIIAWHIYIFCKWWCWLAPPSRTLLNDPTTSAETWGA